MNKEEVRELFDEDKFEEISHLEYIKGNKEGEFAIYVEEGSIYFKPKAKFPKVYEGSDRICEVSEDGSIKVKDTFGKYIIFDSGLPALYDAVELSKKLRGKQDE